MSEYEENSICEKLRKAYDIALYLAYERDGKTPTDTTMYGSKIDDLIWAYVDGLTQKRILRVLEGRVSLGESLKFDLSYEESKIDDDIDTLSKLANCFV